jgi:polymerase delta-interacting protein 2
MFDFVCSQDDADFSHVGKEVKGHTHTFYQVLIDSRDCPYIVGTDAQM